jgi:hypothetical protein
VPRKELHDALFKRAAAVDKPLIRISKTAQLYAEPDGTRVLIRTNQRGPTLMAVASGASAEDSLEFERLNPDVIAFAAPIGGNEIGVWRMPTQVAIKEFKDNHRNWLERKQDTTSTVRVIRFDQPEVAERLARYALAGEPEDVIARCKRMIAADKGVPESAVNITVSF